MTISTASFLDSVDKSGFSIQPFSKIVLKPWGREIILTADSSPYTFKLIEINDGARLSLQAHDQKTETVTLFSGRGGIILEDANGGLQTIELAIGQGYTTGLGQRHRYFGITGCILGEASTRELGTTLRLEDDYARPDETEAMRLDPNRGYTPAE